MNAANEAMTLASQKITSDKITDNAVTTSKIEDKSITADKIADGVLSGSSITLLDVYLVGSIYMSMANVSPQTLFGGTWVKLEGRFLLTSDSSHTVGTTGGSNDAVAVSHTHTGSTGSSGSHTHSGKSDTDGSHTHSISGGSHSHTASTSSAGSHTHTVNVSSSGVDGKDKNMPAYMVVNAWQRTA